MLLALILSSGCTFLAKLDRPVSRHEMAAVERRWRAQRAAGPGEELLFFLRGCVLACHLKEGMSRTDAEKIIGQGCWGGDGSLPGSSHCYRYRFYDPLWFGVGYGLVIVRVNGEAHVEWTVCCIYMPLGNASRVLLYRLGLWYWWVNREVDR